MHECIESPALESTAEDSDIFIEDETDYTYELVEMLDRIGIRKFDGMRIVDEEFDCTYIDAVTISVRSGEKVYAKFPVNVLATIWITPKEDTD